MVSGMVVERHEGTPQGGPLSPLLANVLLDEVDKELERRGHAFVRYADDLNVYVRSKKAGQRVYEGLKKALRKATAFRQRGEKRGGPGDETGLSRLRLLGGRGKTDQASGGQQGPWGDEGAGPGDHEWEGSGGHLPPPPIPFRPLSARGVS